MKEKSVLMSIRPQYVAKILNGEKTIEVRKRFPKDYVGWVYIYATKGKNMLIKKANGKFDYDKFLLQDEINLNGKVVARFWCDKVSVIKFYSCPMIPTITYTTFLDRYYSDTDLQKASCLNGNELMWYLGTEKEQVGYAIHISKLEVFDKPKKLKEIETKHWNTNNAFEFGNVYELSKAPQSWCYIYDKGQYV